MIYYLCTNVHSGQPLQLRSKSHLGSYTRSKRPIDISCYWH